MVEFALVILPLMVVLYGLIYFGMALATKQRVTNAAAEGARAAVGAADFTTASNKAGARIADILGPPGTNYLPPTYTPVACGTGQCIQVTIEWTKQAVSKGLGMPELYPIKSDAKVQFKG
jgi:Flp pilus assembly protein TadG